MAYSVETTTRTPITQLREALDKAERLVVQVDGSSIAEFLTLLDNIEAQFEEIAKDEADVRPEGTRWESLLQRVNNRPDNIVRAAHVAGGMEKLRAAHPPAESFWWHLDAEVTRRRIQSVRRLVTTLVVAALVVVGGYYAINFFFPPNPEAVLMVETSSSLDRLIAEGRWQDALDVVAAARIQLPNNPELIIWQAVLNERIGNAEGAAAALAEARRVLADQPLQLLIYLGNTRLRAADIDGAQAAGDEAMALSPDDPQVSFLLGGVAEARGDIPTAISYFDQTFVLAEESNPQLAVIARVRMGNLLQNPGSLISPAATPTPTP
jgi:tetratricopeptide (TPR) repeat protein